jgi:hypothetical protein
MFYKESIENTTLDLLTKLMSDAQLNDFILVGGTAIALHIGHRISIDLDLFSCNPFDKNFLTEYLHNKYLFHLDYISDNTIKGEINGVQIDCIAHQYHWIDPVIVSGHIRLAGLSDLAAMKLNAIAGNGTRIKDFIDIAYLSGKLSLNEMLRGYESKYNSNPVIPIKALSWFDDINFNEPIMMSDRKPLNWKKIETRLNQMLKYPNKVFAQIQ